jgi:membrane fusion protein (multidrug efflux system)
MMVVEPPPFRQEAIRHYASPEEDGHLLRTSPRWMRWSYRLLVAACVSALAYGIFGSVNEYAAGPAVVWMGGRMEITSPVAGTVRSVEVTPGQAVTKGAVLVRLNDANERAEVERAEHEFELQLVKVLRDPAAESARAALTGLRAERELAQAHLDALTIRAARSGTVADVRLRAGQRIGVGDALLSLVAPDDTCSVIAMLPGQSRPQLATGTKLRFEVAGYAYAYQSLAIESIGDQALGPAEVRRYLGADVADAINVQGPVVLVRAHPTSPFFVSNGVSYPFYHGMVGRVEARVRSESILVLLIPGLRAIRERLHG